MSTTTTQTTTAKDADKSAETDGLWTAYEQDRSVANCNRLIEHYLYMVRQIVLRMSPTYNTTVRDYDDLVSNGVLGLIDAIQRFDRKRNIKFETYAPQRIRGAILDYMRSQDWIPVNTRKEIKRIRQSIDRLTMELGYEPGREELCERLGISKDELDKAMMHEYQSSVVHFENLMSGATYQASFTEQTEPVAIPEEDTARMPEENYLENESKAKLAEMIGQLNDREQMVLDLYYRRELRLKDIADVMGLTESRISQIHRGALRKLSEKYTEEYAKL